MLNILHISPDFNYICGISKYLTIIFGELKKYPNINLHFITNDGDSLNRLEEIGIKTTLMKFQKGWKNIFHFNKNVSELENFCIRHKINIIHTHHRYPELLANQLKKKLKIKTVTTVHSIVSGLVSLSFKSDLIIAVSKSVQKNLVEKFKVDPSKIVQIYNPINSIDFEDSDEDEIINSFRKFKIILFIGRNSKIKGLDILLKAYKEIEKKYLDVALLIISDFSENQKNKILNKYERVFIFNPQTNVCKFYKAAEIVVLPSRVESFPYVMLESGIFEKLFIGSDVGGISEFIENGVNGFLFEKENTNDLKNVLERSRNLDGASKKFIAQNLKTKVMNLPSIQEYVLKLIDIYQHLLNH